MRPIGVGPAWAVFLLAGCGPGSPGPAPAPAAIAVLDTAGQRIGEVRLIPAGAGIRIALEVRDLSPGLHGLHLHQEGRCRPPDFVSAGGHYNPTGRQHGRRNPAGPHQGDLPNLVADDSGRGRAEVVLAGATRLSPGTPGLALVIHADPDDELTDPAGNAGRRIACAELPLTWPAR